jgi:peptidyl-prolyl cis-trans isomerase D
LVNDKDDNIYLVKIVRINDENISKNSDEFINYQNEGKIKLRDQMYSSYDNFLNDKYEVKINQKTIERVKNYFK